MEDTQTITQNLLNMYRRAVKITMANYWLLYLLSGFRTAQRDARILDCGCALGIFLSFLKRRGFTHVEGFDASPEMVTASKAFTNCDVKVADVLNLGAHYALSSFDIVCVSNLLHHVPDKTSWHSIFSGIREILSPEGVLIIREPKMTLINKALFSMSKHKIFYFPPLTFRLRSLIEEKEYLDYFFPRWYKDYQDILSEHGFFILKEGTSMGEQVLTCQKKK